MKLVIGITLYNDLTAKYLPFFISGLKVQTLPDFKLLIVDNSEKKDNENKLLLDKIFRHSRKFGDNSEYFFSQENLGFGRSYNKMIRRAKELGAEYFFAVNTDMLIDPEALSELSKAMDKKTKLASVSPKVLKWDFKNNKKTKLIDTCGIKEVSALRFQDVGQGEDDRGQYDRTRIIGPSGAAAFYRLSALERVREGDDYFDKLMFMYEEDCDLAYRLFLAGYESECVPSAVLYHDRTASGRGQSDIQVALNRKNKPKQVKNWAFLNKHIIFMKYWGTLDGRQKWEVLCFALKMFIFALLFEQYLLNNYLKLFRIKKRLKKY